MGAHQWRRRDILKTGAGGALAASALGLAVRGGARAADTPLSGRSPAVLRRMARLLYPHDAIPDEVYAEIVDGLAAGADPAAARMLDEGAQALEAKGWLERSEAEQIAALRAMEATPFFAAVRAGVQARLYEHPAMWAHLGYPGPSLPFGGYWDKGFDDIDWLPGAG